MLTLFNNRSTVTIQKSQLDKGNYGVFAAVDIPASTILIDSTVELVPRDSSYAHAHFNEYDYVAVGQEKYVLLREPELGHYSLTFFTNEANDDNNAPNQLAHLEWRMNGNNEFCWRFTKDGKRGEEILVRYSRELV